MRAVPARLMTSTGLIGKGLRDMPLLARDRVRYVGEKVAVIAADSREAAEAALAAIVVDYEELPTISSIEEAVRADAAVLHPERSTYVRGHGSRSFQQTSRT